MSTELAVTPDIDAGSLPGDARRSDVPWKIVSHIPADKISSTFPVFLGNNAALYLSMFFLVFIGTGFLARTRYLHGIAEAQRDYEQRFRLTLENMDLAAVAVNRQGKITFCNNYFLRITGWQRNEVIGKDWVGYFVPKENRKEVRRIIQSLNDQEHFPSQLEFMVKTHDGQSRLISWNNTLSYDSQGDVIGVTGIGDDITEIRRTEEELLKLYQAVEQSPSTVMITNSKGNIEYVNPYCSVN